MHDIKDNAGIHWNKFKLVDVFDVYNTKSILKEQIIPDSGSVPYVTAGESNNAVMTYINCPNEWIDKGGCVLIGGKTMVVTYQKDDFCSNDSHNLALYLKDKTVVLNEEIFLFLVTVIKKALGKKYVWGDSISRKKIQKDVILLPVDSTGKIAWEYMKEYTANLEQERIAELEEYLIATGLDDYELTEEDKQVLAKQVEWKDFRLDELFDIVGTKSIDAGSLEFKKNGINFVGRTNENNGIQGKIDQQLFFPNDANTITVTVIGNYKYVKYQEEKYYCSQNINKLSLLGKYNYFLSKDLALYFISLIRKFVEQYNGQQGGYKLNDLKSFIVNIPVRGDNPDWDYMEQYIRATEKLVIADAVKWKNKVIATTKAEL